MSKIFTILTLLWLLSIGGTTNATDWYYVGPDASGNQLFIDNDSVQKSDYDALLWLRVNELGGDELRYKVYISRYNRTILHPLDVENGIYEVFRLELYCESTPSLESFGDRLEVNDRQ